MNKQLIISLLLLFMFVGVGCSGEKIETPFLNIATKTISARQTGGKSTLLIDTNIEDLKFILSDDGSSWCQTILKANDNGYILEVNIPINDDNESRSTDIKLYGGGLEEVIKVNQLGIDPSILLSQTVYSMDYVSDTFSITVLSNCKYDILIDQDWIEETSLGTKSQNLETFNHRFLLAKNGTDVLRSASIIFKQEDGNTQAIALVQQKAQGKYESGDVSTIPGDLKITITGGTASSFQSGSGIEKSFDGDKSTLYHSAWANAGENYFPITLEYELDDTPSLDYFIYYPRSSGSNGHFKQVEIWVATKDNNTYVKEKEHDFEGSATASKIYFDKSILNPSKVKFVVLSGAGDGQGFASCAEMEFYRKNPEAFNPTTIFVDEICSALKPSITQQNVDTISNPFFKNMAQYMLDGKYEKDFRIASYKPYRHPDYMAKINKSSPYSLLDNPTGVHFKSNEDIIVFVGNTNGGKLSLQVQDLAQGYGGQNYPLSQGMNIIRVTNAGLGYIKYFDNDKTKPAIDVHIASGKVQGYYDPKIHTLEQCAQMLNSAEHQYFDVLGTHSHLTYPVNRLKACPNMHQLIDAYDEIVVTQHQLMGLYKYDKQYDNRMYFHVVYGDAYMYATSYRTAYHDNTLPSLCDANILKTSGIWGPAHEVGHCNQTRPGLKWAGTTEVTNNIHSLVCQTYFGNKTRLESEDIGGLHKNRYQAGFTNIIANKQPHNMEGDVFCKLIPFWQLHLYAKYIKSYPDFYADFHEKVRTNPDLSSQGANLIQFVKWTCDLFEEDLTEFFIDWGFLRACDFEIDDYGKSQFTVTDQMVDDAKDYIASKNYPKPSHKLQYLHDESLEAFKNNASMTVGTYSRVGDDITINGSANCTVFEVYQGDELKMITHRSTFKLLQSYENLVIKAIDVRGGNQILSLK
ncbi:MAG: M60 family metallopeptidase [Bacteroidales bacterium]